MHPPALTELNTQLQAYFGFRIPEAFARLIHHAITECSREGYFDAYGFLNFYHFFDFNLPLEINYDSDAEQWTFTPNEQYDSYYSYGLPPELCMFGSMDSLRYGYIVHAPALEQADWPVGKVAEMDLGVIRYGDNTAQGLESLIAFIRNKYKRLGQEQESYALKAAQRHAALEEMFQLRLQASDIVDNEQGTYDNEKRACIVPHVPPGWRYEPASDGIGVLAPEEMFASTELREVEDTAEVSKLIAAGHYASALLALRETLWKSWHGNDPFYNSCAELMKETYLKMGRPLFANRVQVQLDYMQKLNF